MTSQPPSCERAPARPPGAALAFEEAYRDHASSVHALARRLLGDRSLADEITQEVFLRFWRRPERFDPGRGSLRSFLLAECHGRSVDAIRSITARRRREHADVRADERRPGPDVSKDVCDDMVHDQVAELVRALPEPEREAISLAYLAHLTYREVAGVLGEPEGTVKGRIRTGLRRLRTDLAVSGVAPG